MFFLALALIGMFLLFVLVFLVVYVLSAPMHHRGLRHASVNSSQLLPGPLQNSHVEVAESLAEPAD